MKYFQFVLDDKTAKMFKEIVSKSGKSQQNYFEEMVKDVIDNCQKKKS